MQTRKVHEALPDGVRLRPAQEGDLKAVEEGWGRNVPQCPLGTWARPLADFVRPSAKEGMARVAEADNGIVGFASALGGKLRALYVEEEYRQRGIGGALLDEVLNDAREKRWRRLSVAMSHHWIGAVDGIDSRCREAVRFLEQRGFEGGGVTTDVEADFEDVEAASRRRPLEGVCAVAEYRPDELEEMAAFVKALGLKMWVWPDWMEQYRRTERRRIRLVARVEGRLVGGVDALISPNGTAGINYISVLHAQRHQGIGSVLLREVGRVAQQRGAVSMFAGMVPRPFYEANGWRLSCEYLAMTRRL